MWSCEDVTKLSLILHSRMHIFCNPNLYTHIHTHNPLHTCTHSYTHKHLHAHTYAHTNSFHIFNTHTHICTRKIPLCLHTLIHTNTFTHTHTHTHHKIPLCLCTFANPLCTHNGADYPTRAGWSCLATLSSHSASPLTSLFHWSPSSCPRKNLWIK